MSNRRGNFRGRHWHRGKRRSPRKETNTNRANLNDDDEQPNEFPDSSGNNANSGANNINRRFKCPYYGWKLYFAEKEYTKQSPLIKKIKAVEGFLERHQDLISFPSLEAGSSFNIDVNIMFKDNIFLQDWNDFRDEVYNKPREILNCMGLAVHQIVVEALQQRDGSNSIDELTKLPLIRVKLFNYHPIVSLKDLKVNSYGKLICTRGCVIRVGRTQNLSQWIVFACTKCNLQKVEKQLDGIFTSPRKCDICGTVKFLPELDSPSVKTVPFQIVRLQEHFGDEQDDRGRMPRVLEVELTDDLVDTCMPGDDVTVVGIIKVRGTDDGIGTTRGNTVSAFSLYMEAISIKNNKCKSQTDMGIEFSLKDYIAIKEVHNEPDTFSLLVRSLCPNIYGHEMVKAGLLLSLFGGSSKHETLRDDIHVLMVGDPGLGKSQMLQACTRIATRGVYVCGNSSTCSGLTVTLTKEAGTSDFALEPGALVLADHGCCLIDEFDKMPTQHQALLEAMEQQSVSVAKSGVVCSLPARTSILAAANPIGGRYDRSKSMIDNLSMSEPLLSRFDLVFLLLDQPNELLDSLMCAHVMNSHLRGKKYPNKSLSNVQTGSSSGNELTKTGTLKERLSLFNSRTENLIPQSVTRKYIAYARQYVQPRLSQAAAALLQEFYLELRSKNKIFGNIPIYNRQLEALIRLTEARAKLALRIEATVEDAEEIIELFKYTIADVPLQTGNGRNSSSDSGKLTGNKVKNFIALLKAEVETNDDKLFSRTDLMEIAKGGGIIVQDFGRFVRKLNEEGILLKRGKQLYKFVED